MEDHGILNRPNEDDCMGAPCADKRLPILKIGLAMRILPFIPGSFTRGQPQNAVVQKIFPDGTALILCETALPEKTSFVDIVVGEKRHPARVTKIQKLQVTVQVI